MKNKYLNFVYIAVLSFCLFACNEDLPSLTPNLLDPINEEVSIVNILGTDRQGWELRVGFQIRFEELGAAANNVDDIVIYKNGFLRFELGKSRNFFIDTNSSPFIENCYDFYLRNDMGLSRVIGSICD